MLHGLVAADGLAELLALHHVGQSNLVGTLGGTDHLGGNTNTALVQRVNGILVAVADLAEDILLGNADIIEVKDARGRGADTELESMINT